MGEFESPKISETTFLWLWRNLVLAIENDRQDLVFMHWQSAHQYFQMNLERVLPEHSYEGEKLRTSNREKILNRTAERELFLEFHYALGGLLIYRNEYDLLRKIFTYTTNQPPQYYLLPEHMNEIFHLFFKFLDPHEQNFPWITTKYYFPGLDGINAQGVIKNWICRYIVVLYIRQFNLPTFYTYQEPTAPPSLPSEIAEKKKWLENLKFFKELVSQVAANSILMDKFSFKKDGLYKEKMEEIEAKVREDFEYTERTAIPLEEKVEMFLSTVKSEITPVLESFKDLKNKGKPPKDLEVYNITGQADLTEKSAFTNSGVAHLNFHSFLPEQTSRKIKENLSSIFYVKAKEHYVVN